MIEWILILSFVGQPPYEISMQLDTKTKCLRAGKAIYLFTTHQVKELKAPWAQPQPYSCRKVTS